MNHREALLSRTEKLAVVGLGYVGMPLALEFAKMTDVIGFDLNKKKVQLYLSGKDPTGEVGNGAVAHTTVDFTSDETRLREAKFIIVAVPTPINQDKTPDLSPVLSASEIVGRNLTAGSLVVYESTVYPGVTADICIPVLEKVSGLRCGEDFKVGYSPERINPSDKVHTLTNIKKIVSATDGDALRDVREVYELVIRAGTHPVSDIKTAEAIKVAENSQRDINIAFMNELAMVFDRMGIDTAEVVEGMNTKWNALGFTPGLVGGHCIGVDPYYFIYKAEKFGYHSRIILSGREVNDSMGDFVAQCAIREMNLAGKPIKGAKVAVLGLTFKENCADIRNSKVTDIIKCLSSYGVTPIVTDPYADPDEVFDMYSISLTDISDIKDVDCIIVAVAHEDYRELSTSQLEKMYADGEKVLIDVKSIFDIKTTAEKGFRHWRL